MNQYDYFLLFNNFSSPITIAPRNGILLVNAIANMSLPIINKPEKPSRLSLSFQKIILSDTIEILGL